MSDLATRLSKLSPAQRRLLEERLSERKSKAEPIAIVGMGCRFPGAQDVDGFWRLIRDGVSSVSEVPASRWDADAFYDPSGEVAGKMSTKWGAFVDDVDQFDPVFFGISPREAARMDPQQRLLLEVAWESIEQAGIAPQSLAGSKTGVFVGIGGTDYSKIPSHFENYLDQIDAHVGTGNALSIAANRISYIFDFRGPSFAVDTACSSALVALHCAVRSLRSGESDAALAGGVNLILSPEVTIAFSKARMLSPDGVCRPFDAAANGYVRGEGCGLVLLKRLSDAEKAGDEVLGVIRATAINQDGKTSGITAPNSDSQQQVILSALSEAGVAPDQVSYIEAHGTATPLGDPIETVALGKLFRRTSDQQRPCYMTSVKANVGHTETVSGIAGLIKTLLLMKHGVIPPQLHLQEQNPNLSLAGSRIEIPTEEVSWQSANGPRVAGVSSFGFGGTNAHVLLEDASASRKHPIEQPTESSQAKGGQQVLALSAKDGVALEQQASRYAHALADQPQLSLAEFCQAANVRRSHFSHRCTLTAESREELLDGLSVAARGETSASVRRGEVKGGKRPRIAFLFTGQGSQFAGMGRELYETNEVFRRVIEQCDEVLSDRLDQPLLQVILNLDDPEALLNETYYTQPALFALEYALAQVWMSWGIQPQVVMGHSVGEYVAACIAGVFTLEDGLRLIAERGRLMQQLPSDGAMAVVFASETVVRNHAAFAREATLDIAAINGPDNTVVAGHSEAVERFVAAAKKERLQTQPLTVSHAFHSSLMQPILDDFQSAAEEVEFHPPTLELVSNLSGEIESKIGGVPSNGRPALTVATPEYWVRHIREAVQFASGIDSLTKTNPDLIIEVGPTPQLISMARRFSSIDGSAWIPSMRKGISETRSMLDGLSSAYLAGCEIDWDNVGEKSPRRSRVELPTYPFQRTRLWFEPESSKRDFGGGHGPLLHPLLGYRVPVAKEITLFQSTVSLDRPDYLQDHRVQGSVVLPAAAYVETALAAAEVAFGIGNHRVEGVSIQQAMFLDERQSYWFQTSLSSEQYGGCEFDCVSRVADDTDAPWGIHAKGRIAREATSKPTFELGQSVIETRQTAIDCKSKEEFYAIVRDRELDYGPSFRVLGDSVRSADSAVAELDLSEAVKKQLSQYHLHPALLDGCLQVAAQVVPLEDDGSYSPSTYMPTQIGAVQVHGPLTDSMQLYARRIEPQSASPSPEVVLAEIFILDQDSNVLVSLSDVEIRRLGQTRTSREEEPAQWLYGIDWVEDTEWQVPRESLQPSAKLGQWIVLADDGGLGEEVARELEEAGGKVRVIGESDVAGSDANSLTKLLGDDALDRLQGVVYLWSWNLPSVDSCEERLGDHRDAGCGRVMTFLQSLARAGKSQIATLLVSRQAHSVESLDSPSDPFQSAMWGMGRVASVEHPELGLRLIDLRDENPSQLARELVHEMSASSVESQVAFRDGMRFLPRLRSKQDSLPTLEDSAGTYLPVPENSPSRLTLSNAGSIDSLQLTPMKRETPRDDQIEIAVQATGLNFSDVLKALGLYPGITDTVVPMGIECSGTVTAVGPNVDRFSIGDEVVGVVPYGFATHALTSEFAVVHKPSTLSHEEAATVPIAFMTAQHALRDLARLQPGERVLIHAGAGGVGLSAIQIAQSIGAEVFTTAGSDAKRDFLRGLGVKHVFDSRTLEFADEIAAITDGEGVDVVLNSLPGEAIDRSLASLGAFGRFLEIGKTDIYQNRMVGLSPFQDNLSYFAIDLDRMLRQRPESIRRLFGEVIAEFESGNYQPLPMTTFPYRETRDAFRYMAQRKNIGKVIVGIEQDREGDEQADSESFGTYLITGGLGALGMQVAESLGSRGVDHVALLSRRAPNEDQRRAIERLENSGVMVCTLRGDVSDRDSIDIALTQIPSSFPTVVGVVHAAGVLDDGVLYDMDQEKLQRAMGPKVGGAWNLHCATRDLPLREFVLFSSIASLLGSPGQSNYAAGNAFLDSFANYRQSRGLPATTINWGPWAEAGMATEQGRSNQLSSRGIDLLPAAASLDLMNQIVQSGMAQVAVMRPDWSELLGSYKSSVPTILAEMRDSVEADRDSADTEEGVDAEFRSELISATDDMRQRLLRDYFRQQLSVIMGLNSSDLDEEQPLNTMGLDSLMAIELKNQVETRLGVVLPMAKFMEGPSVASLAEVVAALVVKEREVTSLAEQHDDQRDSFPLSFGQQSLWFLHKLAPESGAYHICDAVHVHGPLHLDQLRETTQRIVDRHAAFRTTFHDEQGRPFQRVHEEWPVTVRQVDASELSDLEIDAAVTEDLNQPFDLETGPLLRVTVFEKSDQSHVLLFCVHHIVADFWSLVACTQEFMEIYSKLRVQQEPSLPALTIDYGSFVDWQREMLDSAEGQKHWEYWREQLSGELPVLELPTDRDRPAVQTFRGNLAFGWLDETLTKQLRRCAEDQGATLNMLLLAAYQVLLHRYSGQDDLIVGLPTSGRARAEFSPLVGYFVNPVPIRGDMSQDPSFQEFLDQIRQRTLGALEHQDYPLSMLVDRLNPERDPGRSAMFQAAFVMQKAQVLHEQGLTPFLMGQSGAKLEVADLLFESKTLDQWVAQLDVSLAASEANGGTSLGLQYNSDLFDTTTARRMLEHYEVILRDIASSPAKKLSKIRLLRPKDERMLEKWNETQVEPSSRELVHQRIIAQAKQTPDSVAVCCGDSILTYRELDEQANRLAHHLQTMGAKPNDRIGLCLDRNVNLIIAMQAVLRAGAAYVPLDPAYPAQRLQQISQSAGMTLLLTEAEHESAVSDFQGETVFLDRDQTKIAAHSTETPDCEVTKDDLIYVIYTSGSTGTPKGAGVYHGGFCNLMDWYVEDLGVQSDGRSLVITSHGFDLTQKNLYANLMTGGQLHLSRGVIYDPAEIRNEIESAEITLLNCTPSHIYGIADTDADQLQSLNSLRTVVLGGEPIDLGKLESWCRHDGFQAEIVNSYGPTECTDVVIYHRVRDPLSHLGETFPLGRPIRNVRFAILDANLGKVPIGAAGELCLGGECVGAGYINDDGLTAKKFVDLPVGETSAETERYYRTGDVCRVREDGILEFLGRRDHQIKLRGFRIELGEIEQTLNTHGSVRETVVVVREDVPGVRQLVAYVVSNESTTTQDLLEFAKQSLPAHMVPMACIRMDAIPLTPHGKLDRRSLPAPAAELIAERDYLAPDSDAEKLLAEIWSALLNQSRVGLHDNFFELGGDSLLSIEVVSRLSMAGWRCTPAQIFQYQTVQDLASVLVQSTGESSSQNLVVGEVPLSPIQHWFFEQGIAPLTHFNQSVLLEVPAGLRQDSLRRALDAIVEHHDALRSRFVPTREGGWRQQIDDAAAHSSLDVIDLSDEGEHAQTKQIEQRCEEIQASFELEKAPLLRVVLFELGKTRPSRLLLSAHHLVVDPYSWRILLDDLLAAYQQSLGAQRIQLPPKTASVQTWNKHLLDLASQQEIKQEIAVWHKLLNTSSAGTLPRDFADAKNTFGSAQTIEHRLSIEETHAFQKHVANVRQEATAVLLTALSKAVQQSIGQNVVVDLESHGREVEHRDVDVSRTVGWFVTMHPFPTSFESGKSLSYNLHTIRELLDDVPGNGESYGLLRYLNADHDVRHSITQHANADIRLNYLGRLETDFGAQSGFQLAPESSGNHQSAGSVRPHLIEIDVRIRGGRLLMEWTYSGNCHRKETIEGLAKQCLQVVRELSHEATGPGGDVR